MIHIGYQVFHARDGARTYLSASPRAKVRLWRSSLRRDVGALSRDTRLLAGFRLRARRGGWGSSVFTAIDVIMLSPFSAVITAVTTSIALVRRNCKRSVMGNLALSEGLAIGTPRGLPDPPNCCRSTRSRPQNAILRVSSDNTNTGYAQFGRYRNLSGVRLDRVSCSASVIPGFERGWVLL